MASLDFEQEKIFFREYYNARYPLFADAVNSYQNLLTLLLADHDAFSAPSVLGRVKEREECIGKFARKYLKKCENERTPYEIKDYITDIIGLRLICLYESDTQLVRDVLADNFEIVDETDKTRALEIHDDTFGYKGLHLDLKLKGERLSLPEYRRFKDYQFEVQIRTIVQDAWSVIDHKIKYKKNIPHNLKRRINRLAALFELADQEFLNIRNETTSLEQSAVTVTTTTTTSTTTYTATTTTPTTEPPPSPESLTPFSFLRIVSEEFPTYHFDSFKIDGFVEDLVDVHPDITADELRNALNQCKEKIDRYKEFQRETYLNRMNPYTVIRHVLYLHNKEAYGGLLFELQRANFERWLEAENSA